MLGEFVAKIADLARGGVVKKAIVDAHPTDPDQVTIFLPDGTVRFESCERVPPDVEHVTHTFADLIRALIARGSEYKEDREDGAAYETECVLWHDEQEVRFFLDHPHCRNFVYLPIQYSAVWNVVKKFETFQVLDQKALVRLLRHDLAGKVPGDVLPAFRSLDMSVVQRVNSRLEHGDKTLDSDLRANVAGDKKPEGFVVSFDMLAMSDLEVPVSVPITVDIDAQQARFELQTAPDALESCKMRLRELVRLQLQRCLTAAGVAGATIIAGVP